VKVKKLVSVAKFEISDVKASIAAIAFIITNAVKFNVDTPDLANELQQLGLPKGTYSIPYPYSGFLSNFIHSFILSLSLPPLCSLPEHTRAISKAYGNKADRLQVAIKNQSLRGVVSFPSSGSLFFSLNPGVFHSQDLCSSPLIGEWIMSSAQAP